jgi:hypothetical protein
MKPPRTVSRQQLLLASVLGGLLLLGLLLWLIDATRQPVGESRFVGPPAAAPKP